MCFKIDNSAEQPKRKHAYKIVRIMPSGLVRSFIRDKQYWQCNKNVEIRHDARTKNVSPSSFYGNYYSYACEGIYVYDTAHIARTALGNCSSLTESGDLAIMKVEVDPADWLHSALSDRWYFASGISTYRKVYVPEKQPYMEWY